ncbi:hypothetical protein EI427_15165 [Flammeovirga pectinis]|uniref:DUF5672 domain-containing protein n=1 Tax=Flammeovirga pectinis TaxID=2494373 RepID=A0A3S9P5R9_9BACT|nr:DUF5672 family protein [Flammeovirga pectinis]AZQ63513.1 hypothetical protein EI427_15165 [Flammeovirga pectinis]
MKNCIITIPVYKKTLSQNELISFKQVTTILKKWDFSIVTYRELDLSFYTDILDKTEVNYKVNFFKKLYFENVHGYNMLMVSLDFYKTFNAEYKFLLIYQIDCFIFTDQIEKWCKKNYSYIGAPWPHGAQNEPIQFKYVGNGGLSLRKIEDHIRVIKSSTLLNSIFSLNLPKRLKQWYAYLRLTYKNTSLFKKNTKNEDMFFGKNSSKTFSFFTIPTPKEALLFSIESRPEECIEVNKVLPMGIHAWEKYDKKYWTPYIEKVGFTIIK